MISCKQLFVLSICPYVELLSSLLCIRLFHGRFTSCKRSLWIWRGYYLNEHRSPFSLKHILFLRSGSGTALTWPANPIAESNPPQSIVCFLTYTDLRDPGRHLKQWPWREFFLLMTKRSSCHIQHSCKLQLVMQHFVKVRIGNLITSGKHQ